VGGHAGHFCISCIGQNNEIVLIRRGSSFLDHFQGHAGGKLPDSLPMAVNRSGSGRITDRLRLSKAYPAPGSDGDGHKQGRYNGVLIFCRFHDFSPSCHYLHVVQKQKGQEDLDRDILLSDLPGLGFNNSNNGSARCNFDCRFWANLCEKKVPVKR